MIKNLLSRFNYAKRIQGELSSYKEVRTELTLPPIFTYWACKHLSPRMLAIMGTMIPEEFYSIHLGERIQRGSAGRYIASLGCGDCVSEIEIAKRIIGMGIHDFSFECFDLSPYVLERAKHAIELAGLSRLINLHTADVNTLSLDKSAYAGIMVSHALHHLLDLEHVFDMIMAGLQDDGVFVCADMIGRNGHMRWPEAESIIRQVWHFLPPQYKYNHLLKRQEDEFVNWDCSTESFEGIRAQDILPLLLKKFHFEKFLAFGNLPDVFVERTFGPNFSTDNSRDTAFIDFMEELNTIFINTGILKPTQMFAVMSKRAGKVVCDRGWTPEFCIRDSRVETLLTNDARSKP